MWLAASLILSLGLTPSRLGSRMKNRRHDGRRAYDGEKGDGMKGKDAMKDTGAMKDKEAMKDQGDNMGKHQEGTNSWFWEPPPQSGKAPMVPEKCL